MRKLMLFIGIIILSSCDSKGPKYKQIENLKSSILEQTIINDCSSNVFLSYPEKIVVVGDYIVVLDPQLKDGMCLIFDKSSGKYLKSFCSIGRGPGEALYANISNTNQERETISIHDSDGKKMITYNLANIVSDIMPYFEEIRLSSSFKYIYNDVFKINDNDYLFSSSSLDEFIGIVNQDSLKYTYNDYPIIDGDGTIVPSLFSNCAVYAVSPDKSKLAITTYIGAILQTYDISSAPFSRIGLSYIIKPAYRIVEGMKPEYVGSIGSTILGFLDAVATNEEIYTVYVNDTDHSPNNKIIIFDWNTNPIREYTVDGDITIECIAIDSSETIYAIGMTKDGNYRLLKLEM